MGLVVSHTGSKGRYGYGTEYKLVVPPEAIGKVCFPDWWSDIVQKKKQHDRDEESASISTVRKRDSYTLLNDTSLSEFLSSVKDGRNL
jgi:hypothetical protein